MIITSAGYWFGLEGGPAPGYRVYRRSTVDGALTLATSTSADVLDVAVAGDSPSEAWYTVRAVTPCGVEDLDPAGPKQVRVAFDGDGDLLLPAPNAPIELALIRYAGGGLKATWAYSPRNEAVAPAEFELFVDDAGGGSPSFDYATPDHTVTYTGARYFEQDLGTFADALVVRVAVRAVSAAGTSDLNTAYAERAADASAPAAPTITSATVETLT